MLSEARRPSTYRAQAPSTKWQSAVSGWYMRPEFGLLLQAVQASFAQNQLRFCGMAKIEALRDAAPTVLSACAHAGRAPLRSRWGCLAAAGCLRAGLHGQRHCRADCAWAARAARRGGRLPHLRPAVGLPAAERARGRGGAGQVRRRRPRTTPCRSSARAATSLYRNRALQRLTGTRSGRHATLEELFAGEPQSAQAFFRLNRAAERARGARRGVLRSLGRPGRQRRALAAGFGAARRRRRHGRDVEDRLTLWQVTDITRERAREIEAVSGLESTLAFYDGLPQGLLAVAPDGRIAHLNATLAHWLGLRPEAGQHADAARYRLGRRRGADPGRRARRPRVTRLDLDLLREDGRAFPAQLICRGQGRGGVISVLVLDRSDEIRRDEGGSRTPRCSSRGCSSRPRSASPPSMPTAASPAAMRPSCACSPSRAATAPATSPTSLPEADERPAANSRKALQRAVSGRAGRDAGRGLVRPAAASSRAASTSARSARARAAREGAILYVIDATEQKALELKFAQSHKMEAVGKLAGGVAHDFNNVLTAIIGFSDLLLQTHRPTDPAYRDIMNIKSSANRAAGLVRQLLAFSRRQTLQAEVLELGEVLTDLSAPAQPGAGREDRAQDPAGPRPVARQGRQDAVRAGGHQSGRQCQGCHAGRRLPHDPHAQRLASARA